MKQWQRADIVTAAMYSLLTTLISVSDMLSNLAIYGDAGGRNIFLHFVINFLIIFLIVHITKLVIITGKELIPKNYLFIFTIISYIVALIILHEAGVGASQITLAIGAIIILIAIIGNISQSIAQKNFSTSNTVKYIMWVVFPLLYLLTYLIVRTAADFFGA